MTLPILTPVIFFHLITSVIGALNFFAIPYIMTGGTGFPANTTLFLFDLSLQEWVPILGNGICFGDGLASLHVYPGRNPAHFRSARLWVFYAGGED